MVWAACANGSPIPFPMPSTVDPLDGVAGTVSCQLAVERGCAFAVESADGGVFSVSSVFSAGAGTTSESFPTLPGAVSRTAVRDANCGLEAAIELGAELE